VFASDEGAKLDSGLAANGCVPARLSSNGHWQSGGSHEDVLVGGNGDDLRLGSDGQDFLVGGIAIDAPDDWSESGGAFVDTTLSDALFGGLIDSILK
jgi:hypothetical protein